MAARFALTAARCVAVAATVTMTACSSLPDLSFGPITDGGSPGDGPVVVGQCTCETPPAGWTPVNFAAASRPSCPASETASDLRVIGGDGAPSCTCTCSDVGGGCTTGDFTVSISTEATCGVTPTNASIPVAMGSCAALGTTITVPTGAFAKVVAPVPTSCAPKAALASAVTSGRTCEPPKSASCSADQLCAPTAASGLTSCVARAGSNACPPEFPNRSTAGTAADESKACLGCACGAPAACTGGKVSLYDGSNCKVVGSSHGFDVASVCAATSDSNFTATHFKSSPPQGGCSNTTPTAQPTPGTLTFTDGRTVCCK